MKNTKSFSKWKKQALSINTEVAIEYKKLQPEFDLIRQVIGLRLQRNLTQAQVAKKMNTTQSAIARLESGNINPTINFLRKLARSLDTNLSISFQIQH